MSELKLSFDYSTAQWVLSIIVGVCLSKVYSTIAHHIRYRKEIIFYVPYLLLVGHIFVILIFLWFTSPSAYQMVEGNRLAFLVKIISDSIAVIFTLVALPSEQMLSKSNLNLKTIYMDSKINWAVILMIWFFIGNIFKIIFGSAEFITMTIAGIVLMFAVTVLLLKSNNYYLHAGYQIFGIFMMLLMLLSPM